MFLVSKKFLSSSLTPIYFFISFFPLLSLKLFHGPLQPKDNFWAISLEWLWMELCLYDWIDLLSWAPKTHSCVEKPQKNFVEMFHFLRETGQRHLQPTGSLCLRAGRIVNSNRKLSCSLRKQWLKNNFLRISRRCWASWIPCRKESSISCFGINSVNCDMVALKMLLCAVLSHLSRVRLFETLWTIAHEAPLSMRFSRKEYWSELPCPPPRDLPNPGIKPASLMSPALAGGFFTTSIT